MSEISIDELYAEPKLKIIKDKKGAILTLIKTFNKTLGLTEVQKLMFLEMAENHIFVPFKFAKHYYGPFSRELSNEIEFLRKEGLIEIKHKKIAQYEQKAIELTSKAKRKRIFVDTNLFKKLLERYGKDNAFTLKRYCYDTFYLKKKLMNENEWKITRKNKINNLIRLNATLITYFSSNENIDENNKILICTSFDYIHHLLSNPLLLKIDEVVSGVIIKNCEDYIDNWNKITILLSNKKNTGSISKLIKTNNELFRFLNEFSKENSVAESIFDETPCIV